ncbi:protocadherin gamma-A11-like [Pleurodeles waltl]|uniref:protocadherin gamma-A11-like n=1 Tax=Pleurodeles waltl TaxID=8319 RepID=UPI003709B429
MVLYITVHFAGMVRTWTRSYFGAHTDRSCSSVAQTPRSGYSGAQTPRCGYSEARTPRRCYSEAQTSRRCYAGVILLLLVSLMTVCGAASGQLRYSIPEEMRKGSFVGNVALDLGMDSKELSGGARIVPRGRKQYFIFDTKNGHLCINERIDREATCGHVAPCLLNVEIISANILKVYTVEVEIQDVNDNAPTFITDQISLQVIESSAPGARFILPEAQDADVGNNSLQVYQLSDNTLFSLDIKIKPDGVKYAELVLETSLDREEQEFHHLTLTAKDGGVPARKGTLQIGVTVLDANDNAPMFDKSVYKVSVLENVQKGTVVATIRATDRDHGSHSEITYSFSSIKEITLQKFKLDEKSGEIAVNGELDFEEYEFYEFEVQASDAGSLSSRCKVMIEILNVNDNNPEILVTSLTKQISENSPPGTVIALLEVYDRDSGEHGKVTCFLPPHLPFELKKSIGIYYSLVTDGFLDREQVEQYNITITATDSGSPPLSKTKTIKLQVLDENDNAPVFQKASYSAYIVENILPGTFLFTARATDLDWENNAKVRYSITNGHDGELPLSSYVSINSESGVIYALRTFDFEEFRNFQIQVRAQDGGSPALESNVTVMFFIVDQNDNTPEILYPSAATDGSSGVEMSPRNSETGYLITKVVAVDADSGQNAWLSFQLLSSTDQGLFSVGLHTGEIRTARPIMEKDALKQFLLVLVKDNGQTPLSSSVTVTIVLADSLTEVLHDVRTLSAPTDIESNLTLYLVTAVAVVSFLFLFLIILLLAIRLHHWRKFQIDESPKVIFNALPASQFVGNDGVKAFLQTYSQDVFLAGDSGNSQLKIPISSHSDTLTENQNCETGGTALIEDFLNIGKEDHPFIQVLYCLLF